MDEQKKKYRLSMTVDEIVCSYRQAKDKAKQIIILSELNAPCTKEDIIEVLKEAGIDGRQLPRTRKSKTTTEQANTTDNANDGSGQTNLELVMNYINSLKNKKTDLLKQIDDIDKLLMDIQHTCNC